MTTVVTNNLINRTRAVVSSLQRLQIHPCKLEHHRVWAHADGIERPLCSESTRENAPFCAHGNQSVQHAAIVLLCDLGYLTPEQSSVLREVISLSTEQLWMADLTAIEIGNLYLKNPAHSYRNQERREEYCVELGVESFSPPELDKGLLRLQMVAASGIKFIGDCSLSILGHHTAGDYTKIPPIVSRAMLLAHEWLPTSRNLDSLEFPAFADTE